MPAGPIVSSTGFAQNVEYVGRTIWVSIFSVASTLIAPVLLTHLPQGQELLNTVTDASPEAQTLKSRVRVRLPRPISRRWNSHVRFSIWYSKTFDLEGTLRQQARRLGRTHADAGVKKYFRM